MWFKIAQLCVFVAIFEIFEVESKTIKFRSNISPVGIINGKEAVENQFPYHVGVFSTYKDLGTIFCGGSLISKTAVLTAAQCVELYYNNKVDRADKIDIQLGCIKLPCKTIVSVTNASNIKIHPDFNMTTGVGDLALISLPKPVEINKSIKPIDLDFSSKDHTNDTATLAGWGRTKDYSDVAPTLRYVDLKVISNEECKKKFGGFIKESHMCTNESNEKGEHVGICGGDAGDALVSGGKQIGIASFMGQSCEAPYPSGYTRISKYEEWIKKNSNF